MPQARVTMDEIMATADNEMGFVEEQLGLDPEARPELELNGSTPFHYLGDDAEYLLDTEDSSYSPVAPPEFDEPADSAVIRAHELRRTEYVH